MTKQRKKLRTKKKAEKFFEKNKTGKNMQNKIDRVDGVHSHRFANRTPNKSCSKNSWAQVYYVQLVCSQINIYPVI